MNAKTTMVTFGWTISLLILSGEDLVAALQTTETFDTPPLLWEVVDGGASDIGYQVSNIAGGASAGEGGGTFVRDGSSYAMDIGDLDPSNEDIIAGGTMSLSNIDGGNVLIGWWKDATFNTGASWYPEDFIGLRTDGLDLYVSFIANDSISETLLTSVAVSTSFNYAIAYDYDGGEAGSLTITIDGSASETYNLFGGARDAIDTLDRFGIASIDTGGDQTVDAYLDDVEFTSDNESTNAAPTPTPGPQRTENFDSDPGWTGFQNNIDLGSHTVTQDFGYKNSNFAGGSSGEIGGIVVCSTTPAYYGMADAKGLDDTLTCSGTFYVKDVYYDGGFTEQSWLWFGWFNSDFQGWQPSDFVGIGFPGYRFPDHTELFVQFGTADGVADRAAVDFQINEDDVAHTFNFTYDPTGNGNQGDVTLTIDGTHTATIGLQNGFKAQGADLNMFGIFSNHFPSGKSCEIYFDDIVVNGTTYDFNSDPGWTGSGNETTFEDENLYGTNNYGYSGSTNLAGGAAAGEMGGEWWIVHHTHNDFKGYYADTDIGTFGLDKALEATGKISIEQWSIDSGLLFGWFNSSAQGWPPENFVGIHMDSLTNNGRFFQAMYGTSNGNIAAGDVLYYLADGASHDFRLYYDPVGTNGQGQLSFSLDGGEITEVDLSEGHRTEGTTLNAFGVFNKQSENGKENYVYFDDLNYTVDNERTGISKNWFR